MSEKKAPELTRVEKIGDLDLLELLKLTAEKLESRRGIRKKSAGAMAQQIRGMIERVESW